MTTRRTMIVSIVVSVIVSIATTFGLLGYNPTPWNRSHHEPHVIHFVNYRGFNNVNAGFERYMRDAKIDYRIIYHNVDRDPDNFPSIISAIKADANADVVITWGTTTTLGIFGPYNSTDAKYIHNLPGVFVLVTDPVRSKIVERLDEPGHSITGSWHVSSPQSQFATMMLYKPNTKTVGILYTSTEVNSKMVVEDMTRVSVKYGVNVIAIPFDLIDGKPVATNVAVALTTLKDAGVDWLYMPPDSFLAAVSRDIVIPIANAFRIPTFASTEYFMDAGATVGLISTYFDLGLLAGSQVEQILNGADPATIPVTTVPRFRHRMNEERASEMGITPTEGMRKSIEQVSTE